MGVRLTNAPVLILAGPHTGQEGVCIGRSADGRRWAVSPDGSDEILQLEFEKEFGLLVEVSGEPQNN
jgi:hypothetical protein